MTLLRGQVAAAVRARNRKAPKDRVRSGPRLPARLLGQARNWGGFVQGGGGGGRGESTNPREPPPPPPHPPSPPSRSPRLLFLQRHERFETRGMIRACWNFFNPGSVENLPAKDAGNPCLHATSCLVKTSRQIKRLAASFSPLCFFFLPVKKR